MAIHSPNPTEISQYAQQLLLLCSHPQNDWEISGVDLGEEFGDQLRNEMLRPVILEGSLHSSSTANKDDEGCLEDVHMLVPAQHMMLALKVFKVMLSPNFGKGHTLLLSSKVEVPLPDDDLIALEILPNIVHSHTRSIPRHVELLLLSRVAITTNKYKLWRGWKCSITHG
jgi:hypothetical protein